jgi:hypothetical protein
VPEHDQVDLLDDGLRVGLAFGCLPHTRDAPFESASLISSSVEIGRILIRS